MALPSNDSQGFGVGIAAGKKAQTPYNLRKRKRSPSKDQKENEVLPARGKIPRREKCLPIAILPPESKIAFKFIYLHTFFTGNIFDLTIIFFSVWIKIFGYLETVTIHTKVSLVSKYFLNLVRNSQNLAGELHISPNYVENVFKLNKACLSLLSYELNSKMAEMLKRWPKVVAVKFTKISAFEKQKWLRNRTKTNFERDIFYQFKDLTDFQKAWNTKTLKAVSLSELNEKPYYDGIEDPFPEAIQLNTSMEHPEKFLKLLPSDGFWSSLRGIDVFKIQYDSINMAKYDSIKVINTYIPRTETFKFMAKQIKKLEHFQMEIGYFLPFFANHSFEVADELLSKDRQKAFCDFLKSQEDTLMEITFYFPCRFCWDRIGVWMGANPQPGRLFDYTKFIYEAIQMFCPRVNTITTNCLEQLNDFFPYPMSGAWKNIKITTVSAPCFEEPKNGFRQCAPF